MSAPEWEDKQRTDYTEPFGKLPRLTSWGGPEKQPPAVSAFYKAPLSPGGALPISASIESILIVTGVRIRSAADASPYGSTPAGQEFRIDSPW